MRFAYSGYTYIFLLVCVLVVLFFAWARRKRKKALEKFAQKELLDELLSNVNPVREKIKIILMVLALVLIMFSLLRPQWGFQWREVKRIGLDILIALDTSRSMLAQDVKPNRLERSKLAIKDFTKNLTSDRVGLIAFSGTAFLQCPLTVDYSGFLLSLEVVDTSIIPKGGTSITSAIKEAINSYAGGKSKYKVLIIITDGEDHEGGLERAIADAKKEGLTIFCIGIGTNDGELIIDKEEGKNAFLKDESGNAVKSRLNEDALQKIALSTGGSYIRSTATEFGLELLYKEKLSKIEKREFEGKMSKHYEERFQLPLILALVFLIAEILMNERK